MSWSAPSSWPRWPGTAGSHEGGTSVKAIVYDPRLDDDGRREQLYREAVLVYSPLSSSLRFCEFAREMVQEAFGDVDPRWAQHSMPVERYAEILAKLKPAFIHHPRAKVYIRALLDELGCDPEKTYFDVPR